MPVVRIDTTVRSLSRGMTLFRVNCASGPSAAFDCELEPACGCVIAEVGVRASTSALRNALTPIQQKENY